MSWIKNLFGRKSEGVTSATAASPAPSKKKKTPLHEAVDNGDLAEVKKLLAGGADVNARDEKGNTPLRETFDLDIARLLLKHGADVNAANDEGMTPMHRAAYFGHTYTKLIDIYVEAGAAIDPVSEDGMTPLLVATLHGNRYQAGRLVQCGANPKITDKKGRSPMTAAFTAGLDSLMFVANEIQKVVNPAETVAPPAALDLRIPKYIPLIFALKDLRIRYYPALADSPSDFSPSVCLLRGDDELPEIDDASVDSRLAGAPATKPELTPMDEMLRKMECTNWPDDAFMAMLGVFAFGPGDNDRAEELASHSLKLNRNCKLARQLLQLMSGKTDPRIPFADERTEIEDVLRKMTGK